MEQSFDLVWVGLFFIAMLAGWIDSISGGGGLLSIPALLWAGFTPLETLATNKLQASFGSGTATFNYARHGLVEIKSQKFAIVLTFLGAMSGAWAVQQIDNHVLAKAIPLLLMLFSVYFLLSPHISHHDKKPRITQFQFALSAAFGIGFYDGFFGPGTGTFFTIAYIALLGLGLPRAIGNTKLLNFTSNIASLLFFAWSGQIVWYVGFIMAVGQMLGSYLGSNMAVKHGISLIRPLLVTVSLVMSLKLLLSSL